VSICLTRLYIYTRGVAHLAFEELYDSLEHSFKVPLAFFFNQKITAYSPSLFLCWFAVGVILLPATEPNITQDKKETA